MTDYRDLRYNETCWKATHNSYAKAPIGLADQLRHHPAHPHEHGARGLELDLYHDKLALEFWVCHNPTWLERDEPPLKHYLQELLDWSGDGDHDPITVTLDLKEIRGLDEEWPGTIDRYLLRHFDGDRIFRPRHFAGAGTTLVHATGQRPWPTIGELRGKFIFVLSGAESRKQQYASEAFERVCFADRKLDPTAPLPSPAHGHRVFLNFNLGFLSQLDVSDIEGGLDLQAYDVFFDHIVNGTGYVTRGYGLNNAKGWKRAGKLGVNARATDALAGHDWSLVGDTPFVRRVFSGSARRSRAGRG
jgi:hypothetical protein